MDEQMKLRLHYRWPCFIAVVAFLSGLWMLAMGGILTIHVMLDPKWGDHSMPTAVVWLLPGIIMVLLSPFLFLGHDRARKFMLSPLLFMVIIWAFPGSSLDSAVTTFSYALFPLIFAVFLINDDVVQQFRKPTKKTITEP